MRMRPLILGLLLLSLTASLGCACRHSNAYRCPTPCGNTHLPATAVPVTAGYYP